MSAWSRLLHARRGDVEGQAAPDRNDEYLLFQMLVGSWPIEMLDDASAEDLDAYRQRIHTAIEKSLREGKRNSNWAAPNVDYEEAMRSFADEALTPQSAFLGSFLPFVQRVAKLGVENSLIQTVLKLTVPGAPDVYQGTELWDFSLVDPDNRRPVDYRERETILQEIGPKLQRNGLQMEQSSSRAKRGDPEAEGRTAAPGLLRRSAPRNDDNGALGGEDERLALFEALVADWKSGAVKLATIAVLLGLRKEHADLFAAGDYRPIEIVGEESDWAVGFVRTQGEKKLAVLVARFPARREANPEWRAKANLPEGRWIDVFRSRPFEPRASLREALTPLPFAVLIAE